MSISNFTQSYSLSASNVYTTKTMYPTNKLLAIKVLPFHTEGSNAVLRLVVAKCGPYSIIIFNSSFSANSCWSWFQTPPTFLRVWGQPHSQILHHPMSRSGKGLETKQCSCSTPPLTWFSHCRVCTEAPVTPRSLGCGQVIPGGGTGVKEERKLRFSRWVVSTVTLMKKRTHAY